MTTNLVISVSKLNDVSICPRLYYYNHILNKVPIKKAVYFEEGELMHEGLRLHYQAKIDKNPLDTSYIVNHCRNYAAINLQLLPEVVETTVNDLAMYLNYYGNKESWEIEAAEEPFAKILYQSDDITIVLNGKVDLRIKTFNGVRALVDHKYESQFRDKSDRDNQALAYSWAYETRDFIYNRIGKQKSYKPEQRLLRPYFNYHDYQIKEWKESAIDTAFEIMKYEKEGKFPMRFTGCSFHGNRCTYHDIDNTTPDNRAYKLDGSFMDKENKTVMER